MFDRATFDFLGELSEGRDKPWFDAHRASYEDRLLEPMRQLVATVGARLLQLDPSFETTPAVNKTLSRLNRDMRFARGGSPYKDHMLALFYRQGRKKLDPQLFVGLQPKESWVGLYVGPELLAEGAPIHGVISKKPEKLLEAARQAGFGAPGGNMLATCQRYGEVKAALPGKDAGEFASGPHLVAMRRVPAKDIVAAGENFAAECAERLAALYPLWKLYAA
jgi:uncharacterized protein (TIGR02453 family)